MQFSNMDFKVQGPQIHQFNDIGTRPVPRSSFKRDYGHKTTLDTDYLYPIFVDEILPGDDVHIKMRAIFRLSTPLKPIMDNLYAETFWFFVPYRLVWDNWERFQGQQTNPGDSVDYTLPLLSFTSTAKVIPEGGIGDYFGLQTNIDFTVHDPKITSLYHRGYRLIWNSWFRDENLLNSVTVFKGDAVDEIDQIDPLLKRGKRKDYRTSCLPWPQKGDAVTINVGGQAPFVFPTTAPIISNGLQPKFNSTGSTNNPLTTNNAASGYPSLGGSTIVTTAHPAPGVAMTWGNETGMTIPNDAYADLASATGITINELRQASLYQQILELDARGGTRYVENIFSRFGVVSPDFRLQRPELIGLGQSPVNVYSVPQTAPTVSGQTPQGNLAAFGTAISKGEHQAKYAATEHGMIIGMLNIRADLTYQQFIPRMFTRQTRLEFYEPLLNGLGEQAVLNKEIYAQGTTDDDLPFGYNERFSEYKFRDSMVTGKFRSTDPQSLDIWHLSQEFGALPILGSAAFIEEAVPMNRVVAVTTEPKFIGDMHFEYNHVRPMPIRSTPGINIL